MTDDFYRIGQYGCLKKRQDLYNRVFSPTKFCLAIIQVTTFFSLPTTFQTQIWRHCSCGPAGLGLTGILAEWATAGMGKNTRTLGTLAVTRKVTSVPSQQTGNGRKLSATNSTTTWVGSDMIMGRNHIRVVWKCRFCHMGLGGIHKMCNI